MHGVRGLREASVAGYQLQLQVRKHTSLRELQSGPKKPGKGASAYPWQLAERSQAFVLHSLAPQPQLPQLRQTGCQLAAATVIQPGGVEVEEGQGGKLIGACAARGRAASMY